MPLYSSAAHVVKDADHPSDWVILVASAFPQIAKTTAFRYYDLPPVTPLDPADYSPLLQLDRTYNVTAEISDQVVQIMKIQALTDEARLLITRPGRGGLLEVQVRVDAGTLNEYQMCQGSGVGRVHYPDLISPLPGQHHCVWTQLQTQGPYVYNNWVVVPGQQPIDIEHSISRAKSDGMQSNLVLCRLENGQH
ncbi:hypothetical protein AAVH_29476 [Aphelenchoides avenae]|nr:hypothetical protein AAVH_29476 [Aphelenchus avenae]